jgi:hypothetical protein
MNEEALRRYLIEIDALHLFKNVSEVIAIFDADGSGTLDNEEIKVFDPMMMNLLTIWNTLIICRRLQIL